MSRSDYGHHYSHNLETRNDLTLVEECSLAAQRMFTLTPRQREPISQQQAFKVKIRRDDGR